jgi:anaerobic selenocysteine-containing dehydrogenase
MGEIPLTCLAEEIDTPGERQVRALINVATNPVLSAPNGARLSQALQGLEFMVSLDIYLNETSRHADVILPALSPLEELHYDVAFPQLSCRNHARYSPAVFEPPAGHPGEWRTLLRLAAIAQGSSTDVDAMDDANFAQELQRLGLQDWARQPEVRAALDGVRGPQRLLELALHTGPHRLSIAQIQASPGGIDLGALRPRLPALLRTPDGRIALAPAPLLADLARAVAALDQPPHDLVIVGRRDVRSNNSWMHNLPILAKGPMRCTALVHPQDAARFGLNDGQPVYIRHGARSVQAQLEISTDMMPGVVSLPHGWGHDLAGVRLRVATQRPGANLNALLDEDRRDPLSGNAVLSGVAVELSAVA